MKGKGNAIKEVKTKFSDEKRGLPGFLQPFSQEEEFKTEEGGGGKLVCRLYLQISFKGARYYIQSKFSK